MDDIALLHRYVEDRSESAFGELVRRHVNLVYFAALRQVDGDAALAQDVAQLVFTDLARKAKSLADRPVLTGWLYTSTRFAAANARRGEHRRKAREQEAYIMQDISSDSNAAADWEKLRPVIDDALHTLDDTDREAVLLRFFEGRAFAEIGTALRLSEEAARKRVERALDRLAVALARRGIRSSTAALSVALANQVAVSAPAGIAASVAGAALSGSTAMAAGPGLAVATGIASVFTAAKLITTVSAIAVAAVALGVGAGQARTVRAARADVAALDQQQAGLQSTLRELEQKFAAAEQRAQAADADAMQLLKAIQDASPKIGFPPGNAMCVAFVIDTSGSMRNPQNRALWPAVFEAVRETLAAHREAEFVTGFNADGQIMFSGRSGWLPIGPDTLAAIEQVLKSYQQNSMSNPVPGIFRAMRELPPRGKTGARLHVWVIGDEFIDKEEPVLRRLEEINPADSSGKRRATISAIQLPTTYRSDKRTVANTGLKFYALMTEITKQHAGSLRLLPPEVLER